MKPFHSEWLDWQPEDLERTHPIATDEADRSSQCQPSVSSVSSVSASLGCDRMHSDTAFDLDAGDIAAVKLHNTTIGDAWLVRDEDALAEYPDIIRAGLPVFYFSELEQLRGKSLEELRTIGMAKTVFPTGRVLQ